MKRSIKKKQVKSLLFSLLPFGLIVLAAVFVFNYVKRRGLLGALGGLIGIEQSGASLSAEQSENVVNSLSGELASKGVPVTNEHKLTANQLFNLINEAHLNPFSSRFYSQTLYTDTQQQVVAILLDYYDLGTNNYPSNLKAIMAAYGVRVANNRQNVLLGFLWDNTKGNLYDHIAWYIDEKLPIENTYLGTYHPADVKQEILKALKM
ncbi:MAG: hypothetical protein BGP13_19535 [Sphingobacteriales bacterium 40-81]|nr:MAG: hypothetical protein BGP13_19535 [Sphingobacteriales bacterium 40-81]